MVIFSPTTDTVTGPFALIKKSDEGLDLYFDRLTASWVVAAPSVKTLLTDGDLPADWMDHEAHRLIVETLQREYVHSTEALAKIQKMHGHIKDAETAIYEINRRWDEEADNRGWCDEFDTIKEEINALIAERFRLPLRMQIWELNVAVLTTVVVHVGVQVMARTQDEAESILRGDPNEMICDRDIMLELNESNPELIEWEIEDVS